MAANGPSVDCDFPGGNIIVEGVDGDIIRIRQDLRDTESDWFYWCCRVRGGAGRTLTFQFTGSNALGVRGPALSLDEGWSWRWLGPSDDVPNGFRYAVPAFASQVRLSFAMPYQEARWRRFVGGLTPSGLWSEAELCRTPKGRPVELLTMGPPPAEADFRAALTCRHHCCEMMASYAMEGLISFVLAGTEPAAEWLREHMAFFLVPFVDKDGVEDGDQGKNRRPRDHGRDYEGESLYAATGAIRRALPEWAGGRLDVALDLHCPWIRGPHNEVIYLVGNGDARVEAEQVRFSRVLESCRRGPLPFVASDFLPFGTDWNAVANYAGGKGFARWAAGLPGTQLSTAIEIPYANASGGEVNQETARAFGFDLARGLCQYLRA